LTKVNNYWIFIK